MSGTSEFRRKAEELVREGLRQPPEGTPQHPAARALLVAQVQLELQHEAMKAAHDLQATEATRFRLRFAEAPVAYLVLDRSGIVVDANARAGVLLNLPPSEMAGRPVTNLVAPGSHRRLQTLRESATQPGDRVTADLLLASADGGRIPVQAHVVLLDEAPEGRYLVALVDQTESRKTVAELRAARTAAEDLAATKSSLLATLSHEVRTPMTGVVSTLELLADEPLATGPRELVDLALRSALALTELLNDILDLSRLENGRLALAPVAVATDDLLESAVLPMLGLATSKGIEVVLDRDPALPATVSADPLRVRQIISNLVGNAVKFADRGFVSVEASPRPGGGLVVRIRDNGPGIASELQGRLFAHFEQGEARVTRTHGGSGLGLVIVRQLVDLMGGTVSLESGLGQGSCFTVSLPLTTLSDPGRPPLPTGRWVVVDDRPRSRASLTRDLLSTGQLVQAAEDWTTAGDLLAEADGPVVLLVADHLLDPAAEPQLARARFPLRVVALVPAGRPTRSGELADRAVPSPVLPSRLRGLISEMLPKSL